MPRLVQAAAHNAEVNCAPLSVVTVAGMPKHATQLAMKASVHVLASMLRRGTASTHLVDLLMMVNRYTWPSEEAGRGGWERTHQVNVHMGKICVPSPGWLDEELPAACEFSSSGTAGSPGTWLSCPCPHLSDKTCRHHASGGTYAGVSHALNDVEY
jgi:hypothetical protein